MFEGEIEDAGGDDEIGPAHLLRPNELLRNTDLAMKQQSRMEWARYTAAAELHRQLVQPFAGTEVEMRALDPFAQCAARLSAAQEITQQAAERQISGGLALRDRLPAVNALLKAGRIRAHFIADIISRTDLIEGSAHMADIDRGIAEALERRGSWSKGRMRDMVDAIIFRRDPDLVRKNREDTKSNRGVWANNTDHGMAAMDAHGTAEEMTLIMARLEKLAMATCKADPRKKADRMADALFATVMGREFRCECPNDPKHPCTAEIVTAPASQVVSGVDVKIVLHVIADQATVDGRAENPGFMDGHGVISGDHVRDIAERPETVQRPMGNKAAPAPTGPPEPPEPETPKPKRPRIYMRGPQNPPAETLPGNLSNSNDNAIAAPFPQVIPLPATQPGDQYRPSVVLDTYLRIRDLYCMWPGCEHKAWGADLDHTCEYSHNDPEAGGCTHPSEMKTLCRFHHLLKTYSDWLDDQYPDPETGRSRLVFTTPERRHFHGPGWTGDDLFPTLRLIIFDNQRGSPSRPPRASSPSRPQHTDRQQSRTAAKHARRQQERLANRRLREAAAQVTRQRAEERGRSEPPPTY